MTNAEQTAAYVAMHRRMNVHAKRRRVPRARPPTLIEADYAARLVDIVRGWRRRLDPLFAELPAMLESIRLTHHDQIEVVDRIGLRIVVENPAGSIRRWTDSDGTEGQTVMRYAYGYVDGAVGADGEEVDVYLGPILAPDEVFVVHQKSKSSGFADYDEDKVMLGWDSADAAKAAYVAQYNDPRFFGGMSTFKRDDFLAALRKVDGGPLTHKIRLDVGEGRRTRMLLDRAREGAASAARAAEHTSHRYADQVSRHGKRELSRQVKAGLGVDIVTHDRKVPALLEHFVHENAALIQSLGDRYFGGIEKAVLAAFAGGERWETLSALLEERLKITERHARLIARDQIGKLSGQITRARHQELGIATFRWLTMNDSRVRPRHQPMEGKIFPYTGNGSPPFLPGQEVMCRCTEQPVFDDILAAVDALIAG